MILRPPSPPLLVSDKVWSKKNGCSCLGDRGRRAVSKSLWGTPESDCVAADQKKRVNS